MQKAVGACESPCSRFYCPCPLALAQRPGGRPTRPPSFVGRCGVAWFAKDCRPATVIGHGHDDRCLAAFLVCGLQCGRGFAKDCRPPTVIGQGHDDRCLAAFLVCGLQRGRGLVTCCGVRCGVSSAITGAPPRPPGSYIMCRYGWGRGARIHSSALPPSPSHNHFMLTAVGSVGAFDCFALSAVGFSPSSSAPFPCARLLHHALASHRPSALWGAPGRWLARARFRRVLGGAVGSQPPPRRCPARVGSCFQLAPASACQPRSGRLGYLLAGRCGVAPLAFSRLGLRSGVPPGHGAGAPRPATTPVLVRRALASIYLLWVAGLLIH